MFGGGAATGAGLKAGAGVVTTGSGAMQARRSGSALVPVGQRVQAIPSGETWPAGQTRQVAPPAAGAWPGGQAVQPVDPRAAT